MSDNSNTEKSIIDAARDVFYLRGFDGARMHEIAEKAGINPALLHYYFRSKDRLFEAVYREALARTFPQFLSILESDLELEDKIRKFVNTYVDHLVANPYLPGFILHELSRNPNRLREAIGSLEVKPTKILDQYCDGVREGKYIDVDPRHFLVNLIALCVFPFLARPVIQLMLKIDDDAYPLFLDERKQTATQAILQSMRKS